jgi:hypothetical protein
MAFKFPKRDQAVRRPPHKPHGRNRRPISCRKGDWVEVSQEKGDRLLQDFPGAWGKEEVVQGAKEPVVEVPPIPDLLGAPMPLDKKPVLRKKHGR